MVENVCSLSVVFPQLPQLTPSPTTAAIMVIIIIITLEVVSYEYYSIARYSNSVLGVI